MPRSIWTGSIGFGLVSVPVKLYSALSPKTVRFHQLHASDHVRIQQKRVCPADGQEVAFDEIVKGYEIAPEQYVVVEPEELAALEPEKGRTIAIQDFVDLAQIDPVYYDRPYYLVPAQGGENAYQLLLGAMRDTQKVAIARVVMRGKEHLVAIRPMDDVLAMATMNFSDEVLTPDLLEELPREQAELSKRERDIAHQLVESLAVPFEADRYHDTYRQAILDLIERKAQGKTIASKPAATPKLTAPDLMSALQASLDDARKRGGAPPKGKRGPARKGAAKKAATNGAGTKKASAGKGSGAKATTAPAGKTAAKNGAGRTATKK